MSDTVIGEIDPRWTIRSINGGVVTGHASLLRMSFAEAVADKYVDAEINDLAGRRPSGYPWRPPVRMVARARASHPAASVTGAASAQSEPPYLLGTAGFGFWNEPFVLARRVWRLPEAIWFLYTSPPTQLCLVPDVPGNGWKAQVVHSHRVGAILAGMPALATIAWARVSGDQRPAARWVQRVSGAHETLIDADMAQWHEYRLDWLSEAATFFVDGTAVCRVAHPPAGPLGFVAWVDNQYIVVTPRGQFRSGVLATGEQWLELDALAITPL
ncbi:MAG TPA: hypothetical protein VKB76_11725 [Ktedonobacterales bacterium]|nr:hypothetical protein [Ktedonobacterales bacterium]